MGRKQEDQNTVEEIQGKQERDRGMSDHETTLRGLAGGIYIDASLPILHLAPAEKSACLAGADALRRGTCANCEHCVTGYAIEGTGSCAGPNGSIGGWVPLHASCKFHAPTEPTR